MGKQRNNVKSSASYLQPGEVIRGRYVVEMRIGAGGFGQIFKAKDKKFDDHVAIKIEPADAEKRRMRLEHDVLLILMGKRHIPIMRSSGQIRQHSFIVMQLLGDNISDLRRKETDRKLTHGTVYRIAPQISAGLQHLHNAGYLHRDLKPSNCCIGRHNPREIYVIDFGMARIFKQSDGTFLAAREYAPFRGTYRYASPNMLSFKETGPGDDLISLLYAIVELTNGHLPWSSTKNTKELIEMKKTITFTKLCDEQPPALIEYAEYASNLAFGEMPDYQLVERLFKNCLPKNVTEKTPFDWEKSQISDDETTRTLTSLNRDRNPGESKIQQPQACDGVQT